MGEKEEMGVRDAWQVGPFSLTLEPYPDCVVALSRAGEERRRSRQAQERAGGSNVDARRLRGQDGLEVRGQIHPRRRWWVRSSVHPTPTFVDQI